MFFFAACLRALDVFGDKRQQLLLPCFVSPPQKRRTSALLVPSLGASVKR